MYFLITSSSRPTVEAKQPLAQKFSPVKFRVRPANVRAILMLSQKSINVDGALSLDVANDLRPERPHTLAGSRYTHEHGRSTNDLQESNSRAASPIPVSLLQGVAESDHKAPFDDTSVSRQCDTCSPIPNDIGFGCCSMEASFSENFERFTEGRLPITSGTVEL